MENYKERIQNILVDISRNIKKKKSKHPNTPFTFNGKGFGDHY